MLDCCLSTCALMHRAPPLRLWHENFPWTHMMMISWNDDSSSKLMKCLPSGSQCCRRLSAQGTPRWWRWFYRGEITTKPQRPWGGFPSYCPRSVRCSSLASTLWHCCALTRAGCFSQAIISCITPPPSFLCLSLQTSIWRWSGNSPAGVSFLFFLQPWSCKLFIDLCYCYV